MRFKDYLNEEKALPTQPTSKKATFKSATEWAKKYAPHVMENWKKGTFHMYRGVDGTPGDFQIGNTATFKRVAKNTKNYYMKFIATSSHWKDFPSRESAYIGATNTKIAQGYGDVFAVIPADDASIGLCPTHDLWKSFPLIEKAFSITGLNSFNDIIVELMLAEEGKIIPDSEIDQLREAMRGWTMHDMHAVGDGMSKIKGRKIPVFAQNAARAMTETMAHKQFGNVEQLVEYCLDPRLNGFIQMEAANAKVPNPGQEIWVEGKALFVRESEMEEFLDEYFK